MKAKPIENTFKPTAPSNKGVNKRAKSMSGIGFGQMNACFNARGRAKGKRFR